MQYEEAHLIDSERRNMVKFGQSRHSASKGGKSKGTSKGRWSSKSHQPSKGGKGKFHAYVEEEYPDYDEANDTYLEEEWAEDDVAWQADEQEYEYIEEEEYDVEYWDEEAEEEIEDEYGEEGEEENMEEAPEEESDVHVLRKGRGKGRGRAR